MTTKKLTKLLALYLPYILLGLVATNFGEAWRLAEGKELGDKIMSMMGTIPVAFANPLPSLHPLDLLVGLCCGTGLRLAVYLRGKNAKKYRHGMEYGSARWGNAKDIEPFMAPKFSDNIILTKTERLMMSDRPPDPKNARNKNVLVVGGSGSGKTRFWLKPNLLQCHSSYVVTDPKGTIVLECGNAMLKNGYKLKILNTINFKKSMHYNPFAYVHSEKDILKLVTTLMTNTKGEGSGGDPFWEKSERLLLTALIAYLHYEAPVVAAVSEAEVEKLRLYSDPACAQLLRTAAAHFGLQPSQVMPGNGSDENLFFALRAFCDESHPLAFADITYGCYGVWCGLLHIPAHIIPLKEDFTLDPADYHGLHETIVIANPNAPTGLCLPRDAIEGILRSNPDSVVIVDEAYVDFGGESCVPLIDQYENLLVVQTFSKSRQLAGARLGLAMGNAALIADLNRVKFSLNPYNINRLTLKAGQAALEDTAYFEKTRTAVMDTRAWTMQQLTDRGFTVLDSRANFVFASTGRINGGELYKELKKSGILVRHFDAPRIENWLRITIGTPEQMQALMDAVDKILEV